MEHPFLERLAARQVILADGAMGTQLYARGIVYDQCFDAQNLDHPELVEQIHREYITAGAELVETNTFGANRAKLLAFGLEGRVEEINRAGARIARGAREVLGQPAFVAGSVGPTGRSLQPYGHSSLDEIYDIFREQIMGLLEGGVDLLVLETFGDLREIGQAIKAARELCDLPIVAEMTFAEDLRTPQGHTPDQVVEQLSALPVAVIGANCSVGSNTLLAVVEQMLAAGRLPVSVMPNAGWPTRVADRVLYLSSPEYMAEYGRRMADLGVSVVGGCCGTTPAHIRALKRSLTGPPPAPTVEIVPPIEPEGLAEGEGIRSELEDKLGRKRVISVEIRPPRGANPAKAVQGARLLKASGADAINVLDSAMSRVRMSSVATSVLIKQLVGIETIVHFTTRDRNLMAIQSDLIGAHAMGIRTVLALTGDPPSLGEYASSRAVYDVDSVGLIRIVKQFNQGVDVAGNSIGTPTAFLVGASLNPTHEDLDWEIRHFKEKLDAGADFVMTQPIYDADLFRTVLSDIGPIDIPILMGILPLHTHRHALFVHNELPGVKLTQEVLDRMEAAGPDGVEEGLDISMEMIESCGDLVDGLYIMPSFGRYEVAGRLVSRLLVPA
jgi:methionine synthase / methylenetetrahydrofolate reductase(NADPH)